MSELGWLGPGPSHALLERLASAHIRIRRLRAPAGGPVAVCTATGRVPRSPGADLWIWVSAAPLSDAARRTAVARGAYDAISLAGADGAGELIARVGEISQPEPRVPAADHIATASEPSRRVLSQAARVAATSMPVLLTGETGTGKEVIARLIHAWSAREARRFVPINCAAIPNELMEAELFGYVRGAYSGAVQRYYGQLMAAAGGTVFLDEIDDTPAETQIKLLRVVEDRVVSRLGENAWHEVDFRLIAATNRDLRALVNAGRFAIDLYERLAIVTIQLPPLRQRREDIEFLARFFIARFATEQNRPPVRDIRADALRTLVEYHWPGNIRELRNVIYETLVYKRAGGEIILGDLPRRLLRPARESQTVADRDAIAERIRRGRMNLRGETAALERLAFEEALNQSGGNAAQAARLLGAVGRGQSRDPGGTVRAMMRRLGARP